MSYSEKHMKNQKFSVPGTTELILTPLLYFTEKISFLYVIDSVTFKNKLFVKGFLNLIYNIKSINKKFMHVVEKRCYK